MEEDQTYPFGEVHLAACGRIAVVWGDQPWRPGIATPPRSSTGGNSCNAGKRAGNPCTPFVGLTGFRDPCSMPGAASSPNATLRLRLPLPPREATSPPLLPPAPPSFPSTSVPTALPR